MEDQLPDATLVSLVAERIQGFNLPPILKPIGKVISAVKKKFGFEVVQHAIANLEKTQLARVVSAKSPPGYLWKVLTTAIQNQGGEGGTEEGSALTEKEEELLDEAADWFNYKYTGGYEEDPSFKLNRGLYKSLIPIFRKVDRLDLEHLAAYITDAFDPAIGDKYYRTVPVEESARTFIKQLQRWKDRQ